MFEGLNHEGLQDDQAVGDCKDKCKKRKQAGDAEANEQPLPPCSVLAPLSFQLTPLFPCEQFGVVLGQPFDVPTQHQESDSLEDEVILALDDAPRQVEQAEEEIPP